MSSFAMLADSSITFDSPTMMWLKKPSDRSVRASETSQTSLQRD